MGWVILGLFVTGALVLYALTPALAFKDAEAKQDDPPQGFGATVRDTMRLFVMLWAVAGVGGLLMMAAVWLLFHR